MRGAEDDAPGLLRVREAREHGERHHSGGCFPQQLDESFCKANLEIPGEIWVTSDSERLTAGDFSYDAHLMWGNAPGNVAFSVISDAQITSMTRPYVFFGAHIGDLTPAQSWAMFDQLAEEGEYAFKADTAEELARKAGISAEGLKVTVERYNEFVKKGTDEDFHRNPELLQKIEGTLYALKGLPSQAQCAGGAPVTPGAQVLNESDQPIPGLYATGNFFGTNQYAGFAQNGCGLGGALMWDYIAANTLSA